MHQRFGIGLAAAESIPALLSVAEIGQMPLVRGGAAGPGLIYRGFKRKGDRVLGY
jgi:hypothetical protein